jgi:signal transduction histidine kinase
LYSYFFYTGKSLREQQIIQALAAGHPQTADEEQAMDIAVVGCGDRCIRLMEVIQQHEFREVKPRIIGVADINPSAPGLIIAREHGIFTTTDYRELLNLKNLNLIIVLTRNEDVFRDILKRKPIGVRAISSNTVELFWEISTISLSHKKINQELQETLAKYKMIMDELIQEDVMIINYNYKIADINKNLLDKLGLKRADVIGHHCYEITHRNNVPCSGEHHPCPLVKALDTGKPAQTTHIHLDKNNRQRHYAISTYPMIADGDIIGAIEISRDITKDINVQKMMMQQEKLASIGRLSAGVAHEINNPLTTILTSAMLIQEDLAKDDPAYEELQIVVNEALRCRKIVTSLLDFARQNQPQKKMQDLNQIVNQSVLLTQKQAAFKDITVQSKLAPAIPEQFLDKGQIQQALINLILNAIESTNADGSITVTTTHEKEKRVTRIDIQDTGAGMDQEQVGKIFEPFFTTKTSGTGLGLSITHGIIEQHDGTISVDSRKGEGTCFTIRLPINNDLPPTHKDS